MKINIDLTHIRDVVLPKFHDMLFNENRVQVLRGGRGSGKSYTWAEKLLFRILLNYNDIQHKFLVLRKSSANCDRSVVKQLQQVIDDWSLNKLIIYNRTSKTFKFTNGSEIMCTGIDEAEKVKSIVGITSIVLEEATEFTIQDFISLDLSMRGNIGTYFQLILAFNPISITNWIYTEFFIKKPKDVFYHHSTFRDNPYCGKGYAERLEILVGEDANAYNVLCNGEFGVLDGLIYTNWETTLEWPEVEGEVVCGLDIGYVHPMALVRVAEYKDGFIIDELYYETSKTVGDLINDLPNIIDTTNYMYADSARPDALEEIYRAGFNCHPAKKGPGSVKDGIDFVKSKKLYITERSTNLLKELQTYSWKKDRNGNTLEEPVKLYDDLLDSMRYSLVSHFANKVNYEIIT